LKKVFLLFIFFFFLFLQTANADSGSERLIKIGSRDFPESVLLAEILASSIEKYTEYKVDRKFNLGGVRICLASMENQALDIYPDYSGSLIHNILGDKTKEEYLVEYLSSSLEKKSLGLSPQLGFDNNFVLVSRKDWAKKNKIFSISDLAKKLSSDLDFNPRVAFKPSFLHRSDGYQALKETYDFSFKNLLSMEYNIAYANLKAGRLDIIDSFGTDARLQDSELFILEDDKKALLNYEAYYLMNLNILKENPDLLKVLSVLKDSFSNEKILELNQQIASGLSYKEVASRFLESLESKDSKKNLYSQNTSLEKFSRFNQDIKILTKALLEHLYLSLISFFLAAVVGIFIGVLISYRSKLAKFTLALISSVQTIPSLALLALLIPVLGLGYKAAIGALFIYALLPIIQNTFSGIKSIDENYLHLAQSLALREQEILFKVKIPMARNTIIAGLKTSMVICIGTATLATFVGAGGLGDIIKAGIDLNSNYLIILGAAPAAALALISSMLFSKLERV
jgi:osmoprotectant transport system permease protein